MTKDKIAVRKLAEDLSSDIATDCVRAADSFDYSRCVEMLELAFLSVRPSPLPVSREELGERLSRLLDEFRPQFDLDGGQSTFPFLCAVATTFAASIQAVKEEKVCEWRLWAWNGKLSPLCQPLNPAIEFSKKLGFKHCPFCAGRIKEVV